MGRLAGASGAAARQSDGSERMTQRRQRLLHTAQGLVLATLILGGAPSQAQQQASPEPPTRRAAPEVGLDPSTEAALRRMSAALAAAPSLTSRFTQLKDELSGDLTVTLSATMAVGLRRPDRLAALVGGDRGSFRLWFDGETATLLSLNATAYAQAAMPGNAEQALAGLETRLGVEIPVRALLSPDPYAAIVGGGIAGAPVGRTLVDGKTCEQHILWNAAVEWQIWISVDAPALPCRMVIIDRRAQGRPRTVLEFQHWNLSPALGEQTFHFVPPPGAISVQWRRPPSAAGRDAP